MGKTATKTMLRIDPPDLAIAAELAGYPNLSRLASAVSAGGYYVTSASLRSWARGTARPNIVAWRCVEDHLAAKGVNTSSVQAAKGRSNEKNNQ